MSNGVKVEEITVDGQRLELGEGPHWDISRQSLYYIDIFGPSILRFDFKTGKIFKASIDGDNEQIGFLIPVDKTTNEFVIGAGRRLLLINWDGTSNLASIVKVLGEVDSSYPKNRFNDAKVDPFGRLFLGTMGDEAKLAQGEGITGTFYRYTSSAGFVELKKSIGISNGLTWDLQLKKFYYIDSITLDIKEFDYDSTTGDIKNETVLINLKEKYPNATFVFDGMTIDDAGNLYVATWGGSKVLVINPKTKDIINEIEFPTEQITSIAFGGPNLDILFVTTAGKPKPKPAPAGGLFKVTGLNAKGLPMENFKLDI